MQQKVVAEPFLFDSISKDEPTEFEIFFRTGKYEYRYYLAVLKDEISAETLDRKTIGGKKPARIFYRDGEELTLGTILSKENVNTKVNEWFESCIIRNYANPIAELQIMVSDNEQTKNQIIMLLNEMGIDVEDYRYDDKEEQLYTVRSISGEKYELPFNHESDGTRKLIAALPVILVALQEGRLVIIDELDAKLHPKLLRYVISMFKNKKINKYGAQLLFTSHDIATMKNTVFRRDEIWFAALDENHSSQVYSLYEIRREDKERVNSTAAFDKQYLEGRYGADPYLQNMLSGGEWI